MTTSLDKLLSELETEAKKWRFIDVLSTDIEKLIQIIRVQNSALEWSLNKSAHIKSKYGHEINMKIASARTKVEEIAARGIK